MKSDSIDLATPLDISCSNEYEIRKDKKEAYAANTPDQKHVTFDEKQFPIEYKDSSNEPVRESEIYSHKLNSNLIEDHVHRTNQSYQTNWTAKSAHSWKGPFAGKYTELGLKFMLKNAMQTMEFEVVKDFRLLERHKETLKLQNEFANKYGYQVNVRDIDLDNDEYKKDFYGALKKLEKLKRIEEMESEKSNSNMTEKMEEGLLGEIEESRADPKLRRGSLSLSVPFGLSRKELNINSKIDIEANIQISKTIFNSEINGSQNSEEFMSFEKDSIDKEKKSNRFFSIGNSLIQAPRRSIRSLGRILTFHKGRKTTKIIDIGKRKLKKELMFEIEVSCDRLILGSKNENEKTTKNGQIGGYSANKFLRTNTLKKERRNWKIYRTLEGLLKLQDIMIQKGLLEKEMISESMKNKEDQKLELGYQISKLLNTISRHPKMGGRMGLFHNFVSFSAFNLKSPEPEKMTQFCADMNENMKNEGLMRRMFTCRIWLTRWFFITPEGLGFCRKNKLYSRVEEFWYFSNRFRFSIQKKRVYLRFDNRRLLLKFGTQIMVLEFANALFRNLIANKNMEANPYMSFSNISVQNRVKLMNSGEEAFRGMAKQILESVSSVDVIGFGLSPFVYLLRPVSRSWADSITLLSSQIKQELAEMALSTDLEIQDFPPRYSRLDMILYYKTLQGIRIRVVLYRESLMSLDMDSEAVKVYLEKLNPLIEVELLREQFNSYWAVHEKLVVCDQESAFFGGIDLLNGRYGTKDYPIFEPKIKDLGSGKDIMTIEEEKLNLSTDFTKDGVFFPGNDYVNVYKNKMLTAFEPFWKDRPPKFARLPWRDNHFHARGPLVSDLQRHFNQVWSKAARNREVRSLGTSAKEQHTNFESYFKGIVHRLRRRFGGKSQYFTSSPFENFVRRQNKKNETNEANPKTESLNKSRNYFEQSMYQSMKLRRPEPLGSLTCQAFRSGSYWNLGSSRDSTERSVYYKTIDMILKSKSFIYIEAQYLISNYTDLLLGESVPVSRYAALKLKDFIPKKDMTMQDDSNTTKVHNRVCEALFARIIRAVEHNETFKVCLVLNLVPGYYGDIADKLYSFRMIIDNVINTLFKGKHSLVRRLSSLGIEWRQYLKIFGMKTHGVNPHTLEGECENVYVHSKLLITDDVEMMVGSANFNDRSLVGHRDSEICVAMKDSEKIIVQMGHSYRKVSKQIHEYRKKIFANLVGLSQSEVQDFTDPKMWKQIDQQARVNEKFYREVFGHFPNNEIQSIEDIDRVKCQAKPQTYATEKLKVKGYLVPWPNDLFKNENTDFQEFYTLKQNWLPFHITT